MPTYPSTGSSIDSKTRTGLSTQIVVMVNGEAIGAMQSFNISESRTNKKIQEIGTDGYIEIVPSTVVTTTLQVGRIVYDGLSVTQAFGRGFVHLHSQRIPFDVVVIDRYFGSEADKKIITVYRNCWFNNLGKNFTASDYVIQQSCSIDVESVYSFVEGSDEAVGRSQFSEQRSMPNAQIDENELNSDVSFQGQRGAMDIPGIVNAAFPE